MTGRRRHGSHRLDPGHQGPSTHSKRIVQKGLIEVMARQEQESRLGPRPIAYTDLTVKRAVIEYCYGVAWKWGDCAKTRCALYGNGCDGASRVYGGDARLPKPQYRVEENKAAIAILENAGKLTRRLTHP